MNVSLSLSLTLTLPLTLTLIPTYLEVVAPKCLQQVDGSFGIGIGIRVGIGSNRCKKLTFKKLYKLVKVKVKVNG